jgi:hypothetical protein
VLAIALAATCIASSGCVSRRMTIRTNPPGALVYIDDYEIGVTPVSTDFVYYGTRKIRLVKDGFETMTIYQRIPPPWYQYIGIDFVSENLYPAEIRDERSFDFQLVPQRIIPSSVIRQRAEELRLGSRAAGQVPTNLAPIDPVPTLPPPTEVPVPLPSTEPLPQPSAGTQQPTWWQRMTNWNLQPQQ